MTNPEQLIASAIQTMLDGENQGWQLSQFVLALGLARMNCDGHMESVAYVWSPPEQPDWATDGLLQSAIDTRYGYGDDDDL